MTTKSELRKLLGERLEDIDYLVGEVECLRLQLGVAGARERCALETANEQHEIAVAAKADVWRLDRIESAIRHIAIHAASRDTSEFVHVILDGGDQ